MERADMEVAEKGEEFKAKTHVSPPGLAWASPSPCHGLNMKGLHRITGLNTWFSPGGTI